MILLIDNYDSFVFNLQRYLQRLGQPTQVVRNDQVPFSEIERGVYAAIVISPGPRAPAQAGQSLQVIERFYRQLPILGVCLGHQAICEAFGGRIVRASQAVHGRSSQIHYAPSPLFAGLPNPFSAARYHSLVAQPDCLPDELRVIGTCQDDCSPVDRSAEIVMAVAHRDWPVFGVQFHPESILSEVGYRILANFLSIAGQSVSSPLPGSDFVSPDIWSSFQQAAARESQVTLPPVVLPGKVLKGL